jgi:hypothetical protein
MIAVRAFLSAYSARAIHNPQDDEWQGALRVRLNAPPVEGCKPRTPSFFWPIV